MELTLQRRPSEKSATLGELLDSSSKHLCYTCEDEVREVPGKPVADWKVPGETAIPSGRYEIVIDESTRFKRLMPHLLNVPSFEGVRIHWGNGSKDTEGCPLVGKELALPNRVAHSLAAYADFFIFLKTALAKEKVFLTIKNA